MAVTEPRPLMFRPSPCGRALEVRARVENSSRQRQECVTGTTNTGPLGVFRGHCVALRAP